MTGIQKRKTPTLYIHIPLICKHQLMSLHKPRQKNVVLGLQIKDYLIPCEKPLANPWTSEEAVITSQRPSCKICVNKSVMQPLRYKFDIQLYTMFCTNASV